MSTAAAERTWEGPRPGAAEHPARDEEHRDRRRLEQPGAGRYFVATYLLSSSPYEVYFVNPVAEEILGRPVYASLADLPEIPDLVDVFRSTTTCRRPGRDASPSARRRSGCSSGSWHEDVARRREAAGLTW